MKSKDKFFKIQFNLSKMEPFVLRYCEFEKLYIQIKTEGYDEFRIKAIDNQKDEEKYDIKNNMGSLVLTKMKIKILRDVNLYDRIGKENYYLKSGGDIYEVLHSYFLQAEKIIYKSIEKEYKLLVNRKKYK